MKCHRKALLKDFRELCRLCSIFDIVTSDQHEVLAFWKVSVWRKEGSVRVSKACWQLRTMLRLEPQYIVVTILRIVHRNPTAFEQVAALVKIQTRNEFLMRFKSTLLRNFSACRWLLVWCYESPDNSATQATLKQWARGFCLFSIPRELYGPSDPSFHILISKLWKLIQCCNHF